MAQFSFGSNAGNTAATPNFNFGAKPAGPTFGSLGAPQQPAGSITFGTPIPSTAQTTPSTGLAFGAGTPSLNFGTPAATTANTGFAFGTPKTTGLSFGTPAASTATPTLNFGAPTTPSTGLTFGTPAPASTGLTFGTPAPATTGLSFGAAVPAPASTGLSFAAPAASTAFPLGTTTTQSAAPSLFGTAATTSTPALGGLNFGGTPATTGFSLGLSTTTTTAATSGFSLGSAPTTTTAGLNFGTPAAPTTGLNFGLGGTTTTTTTSANTGLNFKGAGFGTTATTPGLNFSFSGAKTTATAAITLGGTTTTQAPSIGLGGIDTSQAKSGAVAAGRTDTIAAKENTVPNEILQTLETFKTFVKDQKTHSSDVSRGSARPFLKVGEDIDLLNSILSEVGNELEKNQQVAHKLKNDSAKCLHDAEMAQRTYDTPPGLQFENSAPMQYFIDLVNQFEQSLQAIRMQIDVTDKHIQSLQEPKFLTSQELSVGMRRLHDTFVALAGRLQSVHTQVESQKEQYLNLRKYILKDPTNIFLKSSGLASLDFSSLQSIRNTTVPGPTPFQAMGSSNSGMMMMAPQQVPNKPPPAYPTGNTSLSLSWNK